MGSYYNPVNIKIDSLEVVENVLKTANTHLGKVLLLTRGGDFSASEAGQTLKKCLAAYEVKKLDVQLSNPDVEDLFHSIKELDGFDYQYVIGIGGGSVLDLSKSLAAVKGMKIHNVTDLRTMIKEKRYENNSDIVPWVAIPTTSGTGSEVTCWATIWDSANGVKLSIDSKKLYAHTAIIDPVLTVTLPQGLSASTALDALCHATEAYWSRNSNEISRVYALEAISRIVENLEKVIQEPQNPVLRKELALGSLYAGLAFSNTKTTACHSISYPLTLELGMVHGIAASITLAKVMEMNFSSIIERERLLKAFGVKNCQEVQKKMHSFYESAGFSSRLRDYGATEEKIRRIAGNAFTKGRMDNNPVALTEEDVHGILISIL